MYINIIDGRRRSTQKKIGHIIDDLVLNIGNEKQDQFGVRDLMKKYNTTNRSLENYFGESFKFVKGKKIYIIDQEVLKAFKEIFSFIDSKKSIYKEKRNKRLLLAYLLYNIRK